MCEEFHCSPIEALNNLEHAPMGLIEDILELRGYAAAKHTIDTSAKKADVPDTPAVNLVMDIQGAVIADMKEERRQAREARGAKR